MKLVYCEYCKDILLLNYIPRFCSCGKGGRYITDDVAVVTSDSKVFAIDNLTFLSAVANSVDPKHTNANYFFSGWFPKNNDSKIYRLDKEDIENLK